MINQGMMTSNKDNWETPQELFNEWDHKYHFTLDVCADEHNTKCQRFLDKTGDGLTYDWSNDCWWMNPPYGREIGKWVKKAYETGGGVALLPARTDTKWFHEYIYNKAEIHFLKGRVRFSGMGPAPFPSMIVVF